MAALASRLVVFLKNNLRISTYQYSTVGTSENVKLDVKVTSSVSSWQHWQAGCNVLYWYSDRHQLEGQRSYRKVFEQYAVILQQKYPSLAVEGDNFPPPYYKMKMAQFLGILKMLLILIVVSGTNVFAYLGLPTPSLWEWTQSNKFYACLMTFFLCNAVEGQLISTGAFEILLNGILFYLPLWSKLETGRIPQPQELFQMIDSHLNMGSSQMHFD
nr:EOG090X0DP2 [Eurycercus lamellatus]